MLRQYWYNQGWQPHGAANKQALQVKNWANMVPVSSAIKQVHDGEDFFQAIGRWNSYETSAR